MCAELHPSFRWIASGHLSHVLLQDMRNPFTRKPPKEHGLLEEAARSTPTIRFVNMMLYSMSITQTPIRILRNSEKLEPLTLDGETFQPPTLAQVSNRLKVMSGLNPVNYKTETRGNIRLTIMDKEYIVRTTFNDESDDLCRIEFVETGWEQNNSVDHISGSR